MHFTGWIRNFGAVALFAVLGAGLLLSEAGPAARADSAAVTVQGFAFAPSALTVPAGSTVTFTNRDSAAHTATADDGSFDTGSFRSGATATITLNTPGTFAYSCTIHPFMKGSITVVAATGGVAPVSQSTPAPQASAIAQPAPAGSPASLQIPAGTSLLGVPTGTQINADAIYAFNPSTNGYTAVPPGGQLNGGQGYWVQTSVPQTVQLSGGSNSAAIVQAAPGVWQLIGNPSATLQAEVTGADAVYTFDAIAGQYSATRFLKPGQGAWAFKGAGGTITIYPGGAPVATPQPTVAPAPVQQPTPAQQPVRQPTPYYTPGYGY